MGAKHYLVDQFRLPRGPFGSLAGRIMAKRSSNQERSAWTVSLLPLTDTSRVAELGHGPGLGLAAAIRQVSRGRVVGLDHSETMHRMARQRLFQLPGYEQVEIVLADVQDPPHNIGEFDAIFSCNVWLFWPDPITVLRKWHDHLAPGGTMAVTHLPRHGGAKRGDTLAAADALTGQLGVAGYRHIRTEILEIDPVPAACVLGIR